MKSHDVPLSFFSVANNEPAIPAHQRHWRPSLGPTLGLQGRRPSPPGRLRQISGILIFFVIQSINRVPVTPVVPFVGWAADILVFYWVPVEAGFDLLEKVLVSSSSSQSSRDAARLGARSWTTGTAAAVRLKR